MLKANNIEYEIFIHTWKTANPMIWNKECTVPIDYEEHTLINPSYYRIDDQDEFLSTIDISGYFVEGSSPDWNNPQLLRNHMCALESLKRVTDMMLNTQTPFTTVMFVRPDVNINNNLQVRYLTISNNEIAIPRYDHWSGYNDRFAIVSYEFCKFYGKRIDELKEYRMEKGAIVSEEFVRYIVSKYFKKVHFIDFKFNIIRP